jgi:hypothetical protein
MGARSRRQKAFLSRSHVILSDGQVRFASAATVASQLSDESMRSQLLSTSEQLKIAQSELKAINDVIKPIASSLFDSLSAQIGSTAVRTVRRFSPYFINKGMEHIRLKTPSQRGIEKLKKKLEDSIVEVQG